MTLRVLREPAPEHPLLLLMHFQDAPETGEGESTQDGRDGLVGDEQGDRRNHKTHGQPDPPALLSQVVLHLDDGRMTDADAEEHGGAYNNSTKMHNSTIIATKVGKYCGINYKESDPS